MTSAYNRNYANLNADFNAVGGESKTSLDDHLNAHIDSDMKNQNNRKRNDLSLKKEFKSGYVQPKFGIVDFDVYKENLSNEPRGSFKNELMTQNKTPANLYQQSILQSTTHKTPNELRKSKTKFETVKARLFTTEKKENSKRYEKRS